MGTRARFRARQTPRKQSSTFPIGLSTQERWDPVLAKWVHSAFFTANASFTTNRLYASVEKCWDAINWPGPPFYHGGPFDCIKGIDGGLNFKRLSVPWTYSSNGIYRIKYDGLWGPNWYPPTPFTLKSGVNFDSNLPDLSSYGPQAYKMYSPVKPKVDMGTFFGEFRELPKMFMDLSRRFSDVWRMRKGHSRFLRPKNATKADKALAADFLEYTFGWVPFVTSLVDFHHTMYNLAKYTRRILDLNGKWEGRGGRVKDELVSEQLIASYGNVSLTFPSLSSIFNSNGWTKIYKRIYRQIWFRGYFRYYIPHIKPKALWQPEIFKLLLGLNISPSLLWNVTPWSWLIDWFGNVGDILENARDADIFNLVSRNAFLMAKTETRFDFECLRYTGPILSHEVWTYNYTRKQRIHASPYGFGVNFDALSDTQRMILGALAIDFFR